MSDMPISYNTSFPESQEVKASDLQPFLDISPDALVIVDKNGTLVQINRHTERLFGYSQAELLGQPLEYLLPPRFRQPHVGHRAGFFAAPRTRAMGIGLELIGLRKDGTEFPVDISLNPLVLDGTLHVIGAIRDVTAQRLLEQERVQQAERIALQSTLINLSHDAILVRDPINRVLSWNRGAEELYGWSEQEALGRITHTLLKTRMPGGIATLDARINSEGKWEGELTHSTRYGSTVIVESRQVLIRDEQGMPTAVLEINRDITERKQQAQMETATHAETLAQRTFLQNLLDALPSGISVVQEHDARLVLANRAATSIWGAEWSPDQPMQAFLQQHTIRIEDTQGRPFPPETWATTRALLKGETVLQHQETIRQPSGARLPVLVNAVPLSSSHWHNFQQASQTDDQKEPHHPLMALVIHQDVRAIKEAEYLKDEFIGIAAHELRQPLAVLKGTADTLIMQTARGHGPQLADWQKEVLDDLNQATERLVQLTEDLLDVSRLQAGQLFLHRSFTDLARLIQRLVDRFQKTTTHHQLQFTCAQSKVEISIDPQRIEQVLTNLLTNALKYSPQGGPVSLTLDLHPENQEVEICVQDHGIGIPLHQQARIFGRFMRAGNAQAAGIRGTGLGLYLCRALVEQHDGRLWFESQEGTGSTFFLRLPLTSN